MSSRKLSKTEIVDSEVETGEEKKDTIVKKDTKKDKDSKKLSKFGLKVRFSKDGGEIII